MESFVLALQPNRKKAGHLLLLTHEITISLSVFLMILVPASRLIILILFLPFFYLHMTNQGCPCSKIERRLHGEDLTAIDPLMVAIGMPVTHDNRNKFQIVFSSSVFIVLVVGILIR